MVQVTFDYSWLYIQNSSKLYPIFKKHVSCWNRLCPRCQRTHQPTLLCYLSEEDLTVRDHALHLGRNWQPGHFGGLRGISRYFNHQHGNLSVKHVDLITKNADVKQAEWGFEWIGTNSAQFTHQTWWSQVPAIQKMHEHTVQLPAQEKKQRLEALVKLWWYSKQLVSNIFSRYWVMDAASVPWMRLGIGEWRVAISVKSEDGKEGNMLSSWPQPRSDASFDSKVRSHGPQQD